MLGATTTQMVTPLVGTGLSITAGAVAPSVAALIGVSTAVAVPILGAAVAGVMFAISQFTQGCQSCILTSNQANKIEPLMKQNLEAWQGSEKTCQQKAVCLYNFDQLWAALAGYCSNSQFGGAGENCIKDRQQGACHYKGNDGNCWNWFIGYRDPIANDNCSDPTVNTVSNLNPSTIAGGGDPISSFVQQMEGQVSSYTNGGGGLDIWVIAAIGLVVFGVSQSS